LITAQDDLSTLRDYELSGRLKISFDKRATSIDETVSQVRLTFRDGEVSSYDLVIGADGIHSFTRNQIACQAPSRDASEKASRTENGEGTPAGPKATYSGVTTIYGLVPTSDVDPCLLAPLNAYQSIHTVSPHAGLIVDIEDLIRPFHGKQDRRFVSCPGTRS